MKRIIDGVTYNTATATKIARYKKKSDDDKQITMFQTRKGAFFWHFQNYENSDGHLADWCDYLSKSDPMEFMKAADEIYCDPFESGELEMQPGASIFVRVPASLRDRMSRAAAAEGKSVNAYAMRCFERCLGREATKTTETLG